MDDPHLRATPLLDHHHPSLQALIAAQGWRDLEPPARVGAIYDFVRDRIPFGYSAADDRAASAVLADGLGQCNTKSTLLMALLRAVGVRCRLRGGTVHKRLQRGVVPRAVYTLAPEEILHTWVEVLVADRWVALEGVILDARYLDGVRATRPAVRGPFVGLAVGTDRLEDPPVQWRGEDTFIQARGLARDLGAFDDPDTFYTRHGINLGPVRGWLFRHGIRHLMNRTVANLRRRASSRRTVPTPAAPTLAAEWQDVAQREG